MTKHYLLIDGSYYVFYRFYAISRWMSVAKKEEDITKPIENKIFVEKFQKTFVSKIHNFIKYFKLPEDTVKIVAKDCHRKNIWRMELYSKYKGNRTTDDEFEGGPFFKMAYDSLFNESGINIKINHPKLEADDCISLLTKKLINDDENNIITILTSDTDYIQIKKHDPERVHIYNLKHKEVKDKLEKWDEDDPEKCLFYKLLKGDTADNIPQVIKPLTKKKFYYYWEMRGEKLIEELKKKNCFLEYSRNMELIDLDFIPKELQEEFLKDCSNLFLSNDSGSDIHSN